MREKIAIKFANILLLNFGARSIFTAIFFLHKKKLTNEGFLTLV